MKFSKYIIYGCLALLVMTSCSKDFLNDPSPEDGELTSNIIFSTKAGAENAMTGIYWIFRQENYNGYGGENLNGIEALTNRGLQTTMFHFEMKGNDVLDVYAGTYWWGNEATWIDGYYTRADNGSRTYQIWDMFYKAINNANAIIQNIPDIEDANEADKKALIAEAKAIRAYSYFWLARVYQHAYVKNPDAPGVPVYTQPATKEAEGNPRQPLRQMYEFMIQDIEEAIGDLPTARIAKYRINKNVAQAFAAQIYQEVAMVDASLWDKVISNAQAAANGYPLMTNAQYRAGFNSLSNPEWIWGFPINDDESLSYYSIYSYLDYYNGYYKNIYANRSLVESMSTTDIRRATFVDLGYDRNLYPTYTYFTTKFTSRVAGQMIGDILILRSAQLLLIEAEALAQKNAISDAIDKLFQLQSLRDPSAIKMSASSTKDEVINAILLERSKEMFGENGNLFFDYKRLGKVFTRDGNHPQVVTIQPDDIRWVMKIPRGEINANLALTTADQNP